VNLVKDVEENFTGITKEFSELKNSCLSSSPQVNTHSII